MVLLRPELVIHSSGLLKDLHEVVIHLLVGGFGAIMAWNGAILAESVMGYKIPTLGLPEGLNHIPTVIAGILIVESVLFIDRVLKIDDPVGAISVHGVGGAFGTLMVGVFADGSYGDGWNGVPGTVKGILYGDASQLMAQFVGVGTCFVFVFVAFFAFFKIVEATMGNRVSAEAELEGLDIPEMGIHGYSADPGPGIGITPHAYGATASSSEVATVVGR